MDVRDAYHVCRYLIFVERIGDTRLVYEEVPVREDLVHAKETDIFQFLGVGYVVLLGDLIYQYSRQIVLIVVHEYLLLGDRLTGLEVHYMVIVGMCAMRSARIVLEAYRIADDIVLVEGDIIRRHLIVREPRAHRCLVGFRHLSLVILFQILISGQIVVGIFPYRLLGG